jgi:perosamine synthetase
MKIPVSNPLIGKQELINLTKCVKTNWLSSNGEFNHKLENKFAKIVNRKYCSTVSNGTIAIEIAIRSLNLKKGSEVIVPSFTIISPLIAIIKNGLVPVLVDSNKFWAMDAIDIEKKITKKTSAILVVHTYSFPADMNKIIKLKNKFKLKLIEDAAEMHGQSYHGKPCGSFGEISTFSFYSNKFISCGEGGAICTNSKKIYERVNSLRNLSFGKKNRFMHDEISFNARMSNLQAAVAYAQTDRLKKVVQLKYKIAENYNKFLSKSQFIKILPNKNTYSKNIYWVYGILVQKNQKKNLVNFLKCKNIETRDFFVGMHNQPILKKMSLINKREKFTMCDNLEKNGIYLPSGPNMSLKEIDYVKKNIKNFFIQKYSKF